MMTGDKLLTVITEDLAELGLKEMSTALEILYRSPRFLEMDHLTMLAALIEPEYTTMVSKRLNNRLKNAHLQGCPESLDECRDSTVREYLPNGITDVLSTLNFIRDGQNVCILGASDAGKTYMAKAVAIAACRDFRVLYSHCEPLLEELTALKTSNYSSYQKRLKSLKKLDLVILDDFLIHTLTDEREVKVLFELMECRSELQRSTVVCSQREPSAWTAMIMNDEVSANAIMKRATKHYTVVVNLRKSS